MENEPTLFQRSPPRSLSMNSHLESGPPSALRYRITRSRARSVGIYRAPTLPIWAWSPLFNLHIEHKVGHQLEIVNFFLICHFSWRFNGFTATRQSAPASACIRPLCSSSPPLLAASSSASAQRLPSTRPLLLSPSTALELASTRTTSLPPSCCMLPASLPPSSSPLVLPSLLISCSPISALQGRQGGDHKGLLHPSLGPRQEDRSGGRDGSPPEYLREHLHIGELPRADAVHGREGPVRQHRQGRRAVRP